MHAPGHVWSCSEADMADCRGVGARALSNGINSAVFFCFFEALRATFAQKKKEQVKSDSAHLTYSARCLACGCRQGGMHMLHDALLHDMIVCADM